jgi:hypothetical protein
MFIRMFGKWPIDTFEELSAEQQVAVWQCGNSKQAMQAALIDEVSKKRIDDEIQRTEGSFLPLSVYRTHGYDEASLAAIEASCEKRYDEEVQAWTYKKTIHTDIKDTVARKVRTEIVNLRSTGLRSKLSHYASPAKKSRKRKDRSRSSSTSSKRSKKSDSSSSSDSPRTVRRKATEMRKAAQKAAAVEKAKAAERAKEQKAHEAAAAKQRAKDPMRLSCTWMGTSIIV